MDTRIEHHEEFTVQNVPNGRQQAWCFGARPLRSMLAVTGCLVALSSLAQPQWRHTYGETLSYGGAVALDKEENVYVAATSYTNGPTTRITLLKLSASGELLWTRHFGRPSFNEAGAAGLALDGNGNAYVLGSGSFGWGSARDVVVLKFDPDGNMIWNANYDYSGGAEEPAAIALDLQANVYVTGRSELAYDPNLHSVAFTVKFHSNGRQSWAAIYQGQRPGYHAGKAVTVDAFGNAYITGYTDTPSVHALGGDVLSVKYDTTGRQVWARRYNGTSGLSDEGRAIVTDPLGHVYVAGQSHALGNRTDWITLKYSSSGQLRWARHRKGAAYGGATALVRDKQGSVYVTGGGGSVIKYTAAGRKAWESFGSDGTPWWLQFDAQGFLYYAQTASSSGSPGTGGYFHVGQIETDYGERLWTASSVADTIYAEGVAGMAVAPSGSVVVGGSSNPSGGLLDWGVATVKFQPPDYRDTPRVSITAVDPSAIEGGRGDTALGAFAVWRTGATNEPLVVGFQATGTAKPGLDYLPALQDGFGTVTIPAGSTHALIPIQPVNDRVWEQTETVRFTLYRRSDVFGRYLLGPTREAVARIFDHEW